MSVYYTTPREKALAASARTYIYGTGYLSKSSFEDEEYRARDQAYWNGGGGTRKAPTQTRKVLKAWLDAGPCTLFLVPLPVYHCLSIEKLLKFERKVSQHSHYHYSSIHIPR